MSQFRIFLIFMFASALLTAGLGHYYPVAYWAFTLLVPYYLVGIHDITQRRHSLLRNYPVWGHGRYLFEFLRPKLYQYFVESDINGRPFSRTSRSIIYQRAKGDMDTSPFGTQEDVYEVGHEWLNHSMYPVDKHKHKYNSKIVVGGPYCKKPYESSLLNISAMSFGSLSQNAIMALNKGAKLGGFAHNTGEGGLSPYHEKHGGDIIWQIGTGYFGCRTAGGDFADDLFKEKSQREHVKMIEIKLSQGAKPGKGGILPAAKNTLEISQIRGVAPYTDIISPACHSAFRTPDEMVDFVQRLRELSGGKPIGLKICIGSFQEFRELCEAMVRKKNYPDYIAVDGSEGGTGAAPLEFANSVGTPMKDGVAFVYNTLIEYGLKQHIKIMAAGKIVTSFHLVRAIALGADLCYSARGMMMALGCIQALECNTNHCPVGIATQNNDLSRAIDVEIKSKRIYNFHKEVIKSFEDLIAAGGMKDHQELKRHHVLRRVSMSRTKTFEEIYPYSTEGQKARKAS